MIHRQMHHHWETLRNCYSFDFPMKINTIWKHLCHFGWWDSLKVKENRNCSMVQISLDCKFHWVFCTRANQYLYLFFVYCWQFLEIFDACSFFWKKHKRHHSHTMNLCFGLIRKCPFFVMNSLRIQSLILWMLGMCSSWKVKYKWYDHLFRSRWNLALVCFQ